MGENGKDPIGDAVLRTEAMAAMEAQAAKKLAEAQQNLAVLEPLNINIASTGRKAVFAFPSDMTESELFEVVGLLGHTLRLELGRRALIRQASPGIEVARSMPNTPPPSNGRG